MTGRPITNLEGMRKQVSELLDLRDEALGMIAEAANIKTDRDHHAKQRGRWTLVVYGAVIGAVGAVITAGATDNPAWLWPVLPNLGALIWGMVLAGEHRAAWDATYPRMRKWNHEAEALANRMMALEQTLGLDTMKGGGDE